ncbi:MAG: alpha/beta fold hydrolase [Actinomycetota bacterium]
MTGGDEFLDVAPGDARWGHGTGPGADGVQLHFVRRGSGPAVVLLHGWPGFWYDWRRVIPLLAPEADLIAPDLRGFGDSDKPDRPPDEAYTPPALAADVFALLDHLGVGEVTLAAHDIGATVAQAMALGAPARVRSMALFNPPYLGIGERRFEYSAQRELWYQYLHTMPWSDELVGHSRDTVRIYLAHFYDHWVGRKETVRPAEFEAIVDTYARPGAIRGGFNYYRARFLARRSEAALDPRHFQIPQPTVILWGEEDPVIPVAWADRLQESFPNSTLQTLPGVGHFVPFEAPDEVTDAIRDALRRAGRA